MNDNFKKAYKFFISKTDKKINETEFKELLVNTLNKISEDNLENFSGGVKGKNFASALLVALNMILPNVAAGNNGTFNDLSICGECVSNYGECGKKDSIVKYFTDSKISDAQERAFETTNEYFQKYSNKCPHIFLLHEVSSHRCLDKPGRPTKIEEIKNIKQIYKPNPNPNIHSLYIVQTGRNVLDLHKTAADGAIVQVASQYNALESPNSDFSPVLNWFWDKTQGSMVCLQALAAAKHRESAAIQGKLPDMIKDLLNNCMVSSGKLGGLIKNNLEITKKYPNLYRNGYFSPSAIGKENLSDLQDLSKYIKDNIGKLGFNSQWVKCEGSGKKQLQVFNAAPSFQGDRSWLKWGDKSDPRIIIYREICKDLVIEQYISITQVAAIKSCEGGKQEELHIYQIGQGAFYNPPEIMKSVFKVINDELEGFNVKVYLHQDNSCASNNWKLIMEENLNKN